MVTPSVDSMKLAPIKEVAAPVATAPGSSESRAKGLLGFLDSLFVALIKRPLFNSLGFEQARLGQDFQVFACGRLAYTQLLGDKDAADSVADQVAIYLRRKMLPRFLEPRKYLQAPLAG